MKLPKNIKIYGDINYRDKNCRSEGAEQKEFFGILKESYPDLYKVAIHPKNEGKRTYSAAAYEASSGALNEGASDIIIPASFSFVCELKRVDHTKSKISQAQIDYLTDSAAIGAFTCIALGCKGAIMALEDWRLFKNRLNK